MKPSTQNSYHERIDRVVGFLSDHVDNSPSLTALAEVAAISPFHFHRVYRAVTGETPSMTLRRLRLAKACFLLRDTGKSVTEIAFEVAYDSSQSFAKAFRAGTRYSPTEIRKTPDALDKVIKALSGPSGEAKADPGNIEIKVVSVDPIKVIAARHLGPHKGLFQSYGEFFAYAEKAGWVESFKGIYGIPIDDPRGPIGRGKVKRPVPRTFGTPCLLPRLKANVPPSLEVDDDVSREYTTLGYVFPYFPES